VLAKGITINSRESKDLLGKMGLAEALGNGNQKGLSKLLRHKKNKFKPSSVPFIVIGTIVLWVSWLYFNGAALTKW